MGPSLLLLGPITYASFLELVNIALLFCYNMHVIDNKEKAMNKYLIAFRCSDTRSRIVEAPNASAACGLCIEKIKTYEQISDWKAEQLIYGCGLKLVKWPF